MQEGCLSKVFCPELGGSYTRFWRRPFLIHLSTCGYSLARCPQGVALTGIWPPSPVFLEALTEAQQLARESQAVVPCTPAKADAPSPSPQPSLPMHTHWGAQVTGNLAFVLHSCLAIQAKPCTEAHEVPAELAVQLQWGPDPMHTQCTLGNQFASAHLHLGFTLHGLPDTGTICSRPHTCSSIPTPLHTHPCSPALQSDAPTVEDDGLSSFSFLQDAATPPSRGRTPLQVRPSSTLHQP